jgi:hypothetical protein
VTTIGKLFDDYEARKREERESKESAQERARRHANEQRANGVRILRDLVLPAVSSMAIEVEARAESSQLQEYFGTDHRPRLCLRFTPPLRANPETVASELWFRHDMQHDDTIAVDHFVRGFANRRTTSRESNSLWPHPSITEDVVRDEVLAFVQAVLDAN